MNLSCCIWALSGTLEEDLKKIAAAGFGWIDIRPHTLSPGQSLGAVLPVSCIALSHGAPAGALLASRDPAAAAHARAYLNGALEYGAAQGATAAYVVPEDDGSLETLSRYADALGAAAEYAATLGLKLCVEHFPGSALPTIAATLGFVRSVDHPNLYLLLDVGHAQMSGEDAAAAIAAAGAQLGYVHLDDNDGRNDSHLALLDGVMSAETLCRTFAALQSSGYQGNVSLELHAELPDPLAALIKSRKVLNEIVGIS